MQCVKNKNTYSNGATKLLPELRLLASKLGTLEKVYYFDETWTPVTGQANANANAKN